MTTSNRHRPGDALMKLKLVSIKIQRRIVSRPILDLPDNLMPHHTTAGGVTSTRKRMYVTPADRAAGNPDQYFSWFDLRPVENIPSKRSCFRAELKCNSIQNISFIPAPAISRKPCSVPIVDSILFPQQLSKGLAYSPTNSGLDLKKTIR
jgi:hypothetical protein